MNDGYRVQVKFIGSSSLSPIQVGKWDAGMATPKHTPQGRGYETSLNYFGHGNWMYTEDTKQP